MQDIFPNPVNIHDVPSDDEDDPTEAFADPPDPLDPDLPVTNWGLRELRSLQDTLNPNPFQYMQHTANLSTIYDGSPDPKDYKEARASPD